MVPVQRRQQLGLHEGLRARPVSRQCGLDNLALRIFQIGFWSLLRNESQKDANARDSLLFGKFGSKLFRMSSKSWSLLSSYLQSLDQGGDFAGSHFASATFACPRAVQHLRFNWDRIAWMKKLLLQRRHILHSWKKAGSRITFIARSTFDAAEVSAEFTGVVTPRQRVARFSQF